MRFLKQSTSVDVVIGPVWATADGAYKADLAYNASGINCDIYKVGTKADITLANSAGDGYFRAGSGEAVYILTLSTGHTDTLGQAVITLSATGYACKPAEFMVVPANVFDALFGADYLQVDEVQVEGSDATTQIQAAAAAALTAFDFATTTDIDDTITANAYIAALYAQKAGIKKNTELADFEFLMLDSADHATGKTDLTITSTRSIDGAAFASTANSATEVATGVYKITLAAADLNGNVITLRFTATGADDTVITIKTSS